MGPVIFKFSSLISDKDYRKFLYYKAFIKNPFSIPIMILICLIVSMVVSYTGDNFKLIPILSLTAITSILMILAQCSQIEQKSKTASLTGTLGPVGYPVEFVFYAEDMEIISSPNQNKNLIDYTDIYAFYNTKDFYLFYSERYTMRMLKKTDIDDINKFDEFIKEKFKKSGRNK